MIKLLHYFLSIPFTLILSLSAFINLSGFSQITFWTETFSPGWPNGAWTYNVSTGANSASCNIWYVSCQDDGYTAGNCGTACVTGDPSLHVGSQTMGDIGAAYDAAQTTNRRTESPNINTTVAGTNTITLSFTHIGFGEAGVDRCQLLYSINGGAAWLPLANPIPQAPCCGGACDGQVQGQWTARSYPLPATCNNITNLKIAFNWINNNSTGTDPSFAVDNITLQYTASLPVTWLSFEGYNLNNTNRLYWKTASEINNDYFEIQQSDDAINYTYKGKVKGSGNSNEMKSYSFTDNSSKTTGFSYYRIKQVDFDGVSRFSKTISISNNGITNDFFSLKSDIVSNNLSVTIYTTIQDSYYFQIKDVLGKNLTNQNIDLPKGDSGLKYDISSFKPGIYYLVLKDKSNQKILANNKFVKL